MRPARVSEDGECVIITLGLGPEQRLGGHHAVDQADALGFLSADDPARVPDLGRPARPGPISRVLPRDGPSPCAPGDGHRHAAPQTTKMLDTSVIYKRRAC